MVRKKFKFAWVLLVPLFVVFVLALIGYFGVYRPAMALKAQAEPLKAAAVNLKEVAKQNDIDALKAAYTNVGSEFNAFENKAKALYWLKIVPFAGNYARDLDNGLKAGRLLYEAGGESLEAIYPYADLIGFKKGQPGLAEQSAENRLQTAVLTLDKVLVKLDIISQKLSEADKLIATINPNRYPEEVNGIALRKELTNAKNQFAEVTKLFVDAKPFLKNIPTIMGKDKEMTYLVLFQNDKERRATGGFLTAYAFFKVKSGKLTIVRSEDIYSLDASIKTHPAAPREIATYHKDVSRFFIRDSNLSPDVPTSLKYFNELYEKSNQKVNYDGVILMDSHILVDMLTTFGDTEVNGITFSSKPDKRCGGCPQVIYELSDIVDRPVAYIKENRKGILGDLMYALFYKAIGFSPSKYWGPFSQQIIANLQEKHIQLYFKDPNLQSSVESINFAGRVLPTNGNDYLAVINVNFAGAKSNLFVNESYESRTTRAGDSVKREVKVEYKNPFKHSNCNLEAGQLCLNATLRNWVRVYVPQGAKLIEFTGSKKQVQTYDELGKTVFEGYMEVVPEGKAEIKITYELPSGINEKVLTVQKQAGVDSQKLKVYRDGKKVFDGEQKTDLVIK